MVLAVAQVLAVYQDALVLADFQEQLVVAVHPGLADALAIRVCQVVLALAVALVFQAQAVQLVVLVFQDSQVAQGFQAIADALDIVV